MTSIAGRFERDVLYLGKGLAPVERSGKPVQSLAYKGEEHEKLNDADVEKLASAMLGNREFFGPLDLCDNNLTDLAALQLAKVFQEQGAGQITKLNLSNNNFTSKAGEFIGSALCENPSYQIFKITFGNVCLEEDGLVRILEAVNANTNVLKLDVGIVTDHGLRILAEYLQHNKSLEQLVFKETDHPQKNWTDLGRKQFTQMLKDHTQLKKVKANNRPAQNDEEADAAKLFKTEIDYYTSIKSSHKKKEKETKHRHESSDPAHMFEHLLKMAENKEKNNNMPVRKFFQNTFENRLNDAIFALKRKQGKETESKHLFTH